MAKLSAQQLQQFLDKEFPQSNLVIEAAGEMGSRIRLPMKDAAPYLRPGGTISGPTMMTMADTAMYMAIMAELGPVAMAVTTNLNINFISKPSPVDMIAEAELFKIGKRLALGEVRVYSEGKAEMVAHATCTYAIPESAASSA